MSSTADTLALYGLSDLPALLDDFRSAAESCAVGGGDRVYDAAADEALARSEALLKS